MRSIQSAAAIVLGAMFVLGAACDGTTEGGATPGTIAFRINTSGSPPAPPLYGVQLDSQTPVNASATCNALSDGVWNNVRAGQHTVTLVSLPGSCSLSGAASRSVTVTGGSPAQVVFDVTCPPAAEVFVRLRNETGETFAVAIGTTSFGTLAAGQYSGCVPLSQGGALSMSLDGEVWATGFKTFPSCPAQDTYYDVYIAGAGAGMSVGADEADSGICP